MEDWRERLIDAVNRDGRSDRAISMAAGLGVNFVNELRNGEKQPGVNKVIKLAEELGLSLGYVFTGGPQSAADEQALRLFLQLSPDARAELLQIARRLASAGPAE